MLILIKILLLIATLIQSDRKPMKKSTFALLLIMEDYVIGSCEQTKGLECPEDFISR